MSDPSQRLEVGVLLLEQGQLCPLGQQRLEVGVLLLEQGQLCPLGHISLPARSLHADPV